MVQGQFFQAARKRSADQFQEQVVFNVPAIRFRGIQAKTQHPGQTIADVKTRKQYGTDMSFGEERRVRIARGHVSRVGDFNDPQMSQARAKP